MLKSEIVSELSRKYSDMPYETVESVVNYIFNKMVTSLVHGERIEVRGFGSFSLRYRKPYLARNPRTGEKVAAKGKYTVYFRAGKELNNRINK